MDRGTDAATGLLPPLCMVFIVPLIDHSGPQGALTVASTAPAAFDAAAERWLMLAAGVAAPALRAALRPSTENPPSPHGASVSRNAK